MTEQKTEQKNTPPQEPQHKAVSLEGVKLELEKIDKTILIKAKASSERDISISYPLDEFHKATSKTKQYPKGSKRVNINLVSDSVSITFMRKHIEAMITKQIGLSPVQFTELNDFVNDKDLYQAFNLWVAVVVKSFKHLLLTTE